MVNQKPFRTQPLWSVPSLCPLRSNKLKEIKKKKKGVVGSWNLETRGGKGQGNRGWSL